MIGDVERKHNVPRKDNLLFTSSLPACLLGCISHFNGKWAGRREQGSCGAFVIISPMQFHYFKPFPGSYFPKLSEQKFNFNFSRYIRSISGSGLSISGSGPSISRSSPSISSCGLRISRFDLRISRCGLSISGSGLSISGSRRSISRCGRSISRSIRSISGSRRSISRCGLSISGSRQ